MAKKQPNLLFFDGFDIEICVLGSALSSSLKIKLFSLI